MGLMVDAAMRVSYCLYCIGLNFSDGLEVSGRLNICDMVYPRSANAFLAISKSEKWCFTALVHPDSFHALTGNQNDVVRGSLLNRITDGNGTINFLTRSG